MSIARIANGTLLKVGNDIAGASVSYTTVPEMMKLDGPDIKFDLLDVTSHDSSGYFREYIPGLADGSAITGELNFRTSNSIHKGIRIDAYARTNRDFELIFPDISDNTVKLSTYVQSFAPSAGIGAILKAALSLKITGQPAWS